MQPHSYQMTDEYNGAFFYLPTGISMHKGYAFVQFTNPFDARNACHGEDGRTILSQVLGKCMVFYSTVFLVTSCCRVSFIIIIIH